MEHILQAIDDALERKGLSAAAASRLAGGNPSIIKNLRRPKGGTLAHPIENLLKVAEVLDLEVYVGPKRRGDTADFRMSETGEAYEAKSNWSAEVKSDWIAPRFHEETGLGKGIAELAFDHAWVEGRNLDPDCLAVARVLVSGELEGLDRDDLAILDTRVDKLDGRPFAWFGGTMDRLRFGRLLQLSTGPIVVALDDGSPLHSIDRRASLRVIGSVVASLRTARYDVPVTSSGETE